jgi:hypothetical protein
MRIEIGGRGYNLDTSAISTLRYRLQYGRSAMQDFLDGADVYTKVVYTCITEEKPEYIEFSRDAEQDSQFELKALSVIRQLFRKDIRKRVSSADAADEAAEEFDEYVVLAMFADTGLPDFLWREAGILQIADVINAYYTLKDPERIKKRNMTNKQVKAAYNITPEKEKQIEAYLQKNNRE